MESQAEERSEWRERLADRAYGVLFRSHPFQQGPDVAAALQHILRDPEIHEVLDLPEQRPAQ